MELGVDLNVANAEGNTALHTAADASLDPIVKLLVEKGADDEHARSSPSPAGARPETS